MVDGQNGQDHSSHIGATGGGGGSEDYFSYHGGSGNRRRSGSSAPPPRARFAMQDSDNESDPDTSDVRAETRANTAFNRGPLRFHVTPPGDDNFSLSDSRMGLGSLGSQVSGGLAPGSHQVDDDDPNDEEYRARRDALLARMGVSNSQPSTPQESDNENESEARRMNAIPLHNLERIVSDVSTPTDTPIEGQSPMELEKEKSAPQTPEEKEALARQEAEEIAKSLVTQHLGKRPAQGYVDNHQFLLNAGLQDEDIAVGEGAHHVSDEPEKDATERAHPEKSEASQESPEESHNVEDGTEYHDPDGDYVPPPKQVKEGILGSLLRLYAGEQDGQSSKTGSSTQPSPQASASPTPTGSPSLTPVSPAASDDASSRKPSSSSSKLKRPSYLRTSSEDALRKMKPSNLFKHKHSNSSLSLGKLAASSLGAVNHLGTVAPQTLEYEKKQAQKAKHEIQKQIAKKKKKEKKLAEQKRITVHIADVLQRQRFILRLGRALMLFGAPSHRLEEYLKMTARVLEIDGQFLYMPGCMLVAFGDATTHTSETKLIRCVQGLNLTKLDATHIIYKEVVHDLMGLEEASAHIDNLLKSKSVYPWWLATVFFALASASIGCFSFGGHWRDIPIILLLSLMVGFLQNWAQPRSDLYANVFEVSSSILVSFLGRAFGTIMVGRDPPFFCFPAIVQGSLSLILPGYVILCGALELQSKNLVAGSVRMFYAIIYSLFLSFGIALGATIFGWFDHNATNLTDQKKCEGLDAKWKILFVPLASLFLATVNQASYRQLPVMIIISSAGYTVLYFIQQKVNSTSAFSSAIGAFTIGILGNLYSRIGHGLAFAAMLPGIFAIVPSGIAAQGSLVDGVCVANSITNHTGNNTSDDCNSNNNNNSTGFSGLGGSMTQVAVGITVGLFAATLIVYPLGLGKKRSGLFTF